MGLKAAGLLRDVMDKGVALIMAEFIQPVL